MKLLRNRWTPLSALSLISALWLPWAFPRLHPSARLNLVFDRDTYISMARDFAARHMMDVSGWGVYVQAESFIKNQDLRLTMPNDDMARHFPDAAVHTYFLPSGNGASAKLTVRPDGHPLDWKFPLPREMKKADMDMPDPVMHELAGADSSHYNGVTIAGNTDAAQNEFKWQMAEHSPGSAHIAIDESVRNGLVWKADTIYTLPEAVAKRFDAFPVVRLVGGIGWYVLMIVAGVLAVLREGSSRTARAMKEGSAIVLACAVGASIALNLILSWGSVAAESPSTSSGAYEVLAVLMGATALGLPYYLMGAGTALCARLHPARVRGYRLLGSRDILSRNVGTELFAGWLASAVTLALPLAMGAVIGRPTFGGYSDDFLLSRFPIVVGLLDAFDSAALGLVGLFGLMIPLALRFLRKHEGAGSKWILPVSATLAITTFAMLTGPFREAAVATWVWVGLQGCFVLWLYLRFGMLAAITSHCAARVLANAGAGLVQPAAGVQSVGLGLLAVFGVFGLLTMLVAWRAKESTTELYGEGGLARHARSRREQLKVEFHVARSAQQRMLPSSPPVLDGYSLSAHCEPAREVGGDLYDFIRLRDGRWGIGVADVSGKGVPAALYMTLTKGLLCAAAQDSGDPGHILGSVNRHLRAVAKKKMFVTMALGVLDPELRTLEYARAGHNPVVWRRAAARETRLLSGPGIGLGIASPMLFGKTLKTERLELASGDALVFYSDGLTEAMNELLEQFGEERLVEAVESTDGMHAEATRDSILKEVKRFLKGGNSQDDLTIAVLRVG